MCTLTNGQSDTISVDQTVVRTITVFKTITVGSSPFGAVFDPSNGYVYLTNCGSDTVSVINGSSNKYSK
ncbi:MAG: hypothetical protein AMDU5_GPLC00014G0128 [Thermoplasmatales archaeon Gpl]|nr:MAG: hypothetical protein AMDU5_GPLC00014G0128 [Thermoplasmatales archaeon Gpl]